MKKDETRTEGKGLPLFTAEEHNGILSVEFAGTAREVLGMKLNAIRQMRRLLADQKKHASKAIVITVKPGILSSSNIDILLAKHGVYPFGRLQERSAPSSPQVHLTDFIREANYTKSLIQELRSMDGYVIIVLNGELPLALFGTALACDYRIAAEDFILVNRIPQTGFTPLGGLPWFLTRIVGRAKARGILMKAGTISACEALELGLIDRIAPKSRLRHEAMAEAKRVSALPWGCRVGLKRALTLTDQPLGDYLDEESDIFERSLEMMVSSTQAASLENIT